ncbi:MAG: hypothetical protein LBJ08_01725 [Bifidobacteriaceae bacterium]|jgi:hypothetical protein|nr:hypothetical protein [Bifidobacteriaceae bacterium]
MNRFAAAVCLAMSVALAGCASQDDRETNSDPFAAEFEAEIAATDSDFIREVLTDHVISQGEISEALSLFSDCVADVGVMLSSLAIETYTAPTAQVEAHRDEVRDCESRYYAPINYLVGTMERNPDNRDWDELTVECLVREGLVPEGYTVTEYKEVMSRAFDQITANSDGTQHTQYAVEPDLKFPGGTDPKSNEVGECQEDPLSLIEDDPLVVGPSPSATVQ